MNRPALSEVSPLVYWAGWGYFATNIMIGLSFLLLFRPVVPVLIVSGSFSYPFWGIVFILLGVSMGVALWRNEWGWLKFLFLTGILIKMFWLTALLERVLHDVNTLSIAIIWIFFAYMQFLCFIFFIPEDPNG